MLSDVEAVCEISRDVAKFEVGRPAQSVRKRFVDVLLSLLALFYLSPLLIVIALLIRMETPGPVIFRQARGGLGGEPFEILKFRSMRFDAAAEVRHAVRGDTRVTRVGAFLRQSSLDELPQLLNVLRGEMSLVGPRPHAIEHDRLYGAVLPEYVERFRAKPGITGWAQISGLRGEVDGVEEMRERVAHDLHYIQNWSVWLDMRVMAKTVIKCLFDRKAY